MQIRDCTARDAEAILAIYNHYVETSIATLDEAVWDRARMSAWIEQVTSRYPWLVAEDDGRVLGYVYASPWKPKCAYRSTVESTVYIAPGRVRQGLGTRLYGALLGRLPGLGIHAVVAGISLPNPASVALHERLCFEKVAEFEQMGKKLDQWIDVGYWELLLPLEK